MKRVCSRTLAFLMENTAIQPPWNPSNDDHSAEKQPHRDVADLAVVFARVFERVGRSGENDLGIVETEAPLGERVSGASQDPRRSPSIIRNAI
ncbi:MULTISPECIES: hypothetical protein [Methylobacterium]|uniref:hypothetical protein n=1 Tax=Methylobacterium TaxID=407 RepID=UPI001AEDA19D|nr:MULTISPECIES: hypothetical protein [Methylobacterium]